MPLSNVEMQQPIYRVIDPTDEFKEYQLATLGLAYDEEFIITSDYLFISSQLPSLETCPADQTIRWNSQPFIIGGIPEDREVYVGE